ncbi:hypothetical protein L901_16640 [Agrobacterium sp. D14]|nr:hypothetical protein L901_16640 [Agrobacterium sp. D14]
MKLEVIFAPIMIRQLNFLRDALRLFFILTTTMRVGSFSFRALK